ncbi:MAG: ABC transporter permease [Vicinamibacterales bacterium]
MLADVRLAIRTLRRQPAFTVTALLTLALGIGANTAIFSVVYGVLLRPLPYPQPEELVRIYEEHPGGSSPLGMNWISDITVNAWRPGMRTLSHLAGYSSYVETVGRTEPERWQSGVVSPALFPMLRVAPAAGRFFEESDAKEGAADVALLGYQTWRDRYAARPDAIGQALWVDGKPYQIIGVTPAGFSFPNPDIKFYRPYIIPTFVPAGGSRIRVFQAMARLADGVSPGQASAEGTAAARSVTRPPVASMMFGKGGPVEVHVVGFVDQLTSQIRPALLVLAVGVGFVLLIACANVANLFLSRGVARQRELAVRAALGAGRARLVRHLLAESLVLSGFGGVLGVALAWLLIRLLPSVAPASLPRLTDIHLDGVTLLFAVVVAFTTGMLSGTLPALRGARAGLMDAMLDGDRRATGSSAGRLRSGLLVAEAALAVMLLVGASLLARSFVALTRVDGGFDASNVLTGQILLPPSATPETANSTMALDILSRLETLPGVQAVGAGNMAPLAPTSAIRMVTLPERDAAGEKIIARAIGWTVTPGYAEALGLRLKSGRFLNAADIDAATQAVLVNEEFVRLYWPDGKPVVGRQYDAVFSEKGLTEVVGVVANTLKDGYDKQPEPELYAPVRRMRPSMSRGMYVAIRTGRDPLTLVPDIRRVVLDVEPRAAFEGLGLLSAKVSGSVAAPRFSAAVLGAFAALALLLAAIGLYGVLSYGVSQRLRELGIRAAMGASRSELVGLVLREGLAVVSLGLALGLGAAAALSRYTQSLLFGVTPLDAWSYVAAPAVLLLVALAACAIPARRAASVDPAEALRCE